MAATKNPVGWKRYYEVIAKIPRGSVSTYGDIAVFAGRPRTARQVGYALAALRDAPTRVPWHRVLGKRNRRAAVVSIRDAAGAGAQRQRLEREGVTFEPGGWVSLERFAWNGEVKKQRRK